MRQAFAGLAEAAALPPLVAAALPFTANANLAEPS